MTRQDRPGYRLPVHLTAIFWYLAIGGGVLVGSLLDKIAHWIGWR